MELTLDLTADREDSFYCDEAGRKLVCFSFVGDWFDRPDPLLPDRIRVRIGSNLPPARERFIEAEWSDGGIIVYENGEERWIGVEPSLYRDLRRARVLSGPRGAALWCCIQRLET